MALFAILVGVSTTRSASAEVPLTLEWDAPKECPSSAYVVQRVEQILHGAERERVGVTATGKIARAKGRERFELVLVVRSGDFEETKVLDAPSCVGLAEAAAVVVSLAIRSSDAVPPATAPPPVETSTEPLPLPPVSSAPSEERSPRASSASQSSLAPSEGEIRTPGRHEPKGLTFAFDLGASVVSGPLPHAAPGASAAAALRMGRLRAGLLGTFSFRQTEAFGETARASFDMADIGAFGAYLVPVGVFAIGPQADLEATFVRVQGAGIRTPEASTSVWPTIVFGARAEARLTRWLGVFARGDLLFPLGAPRFTLVTAGEALILHEPAAVAPRLSLGIEIVVP